MTRLCRSLSACALALRFIDSEDAVAWCWRVRQVYHFQADEGDFSQANHLRDAAGLAYALFLVVFTLQHRLAPTWQVINKGDYTEKERAEFKSIVHMNVCQVQEPAKGR